MAGEAILDTSFVVHVLNGNPRARSRISELSQTYLPCIAAGELFFGAIKSRRVEDNIQKVEHFVSACVIVPVDLTPAPLYGRLKHEGFTKGRPIPENDLWIAALAIQYEMVLVTSDRHFETVDGLK